MRIKIFFLVAFSLYVSQPLWACDEALKRFPQDCRIQDRYRDVRDRFRKENVDIDEVAEYRVLRFVGRGAWENAKAKQTSPENIYEPSPATWQVWDSGIRAIFAPNGIDITRMNKEVFSQIHRSLLSEQTQDVHTDRTHKPGQFRQSGDINVGYCQRASQSVQADMNAKSQQLTAIQQELIMKVNQLLINGSSAQDRKNLSYDMQMLTERKLIQAIPDIRDTCAKRYAQDGQSYFWVQYVESYLVNSHLKLWLELLNKTLQSYQSQNMSISPIAFASMMQKWMVTIHPFADGNGRFSRAIQELILAHFDLPKVPAGDLGEDADIGFEQYARNNYDKTSAMLKSLEDCAAWYEAGRDGKKAFSKEKKLLKWQCSTVDKLNK